MAQMRKGCYTIEALNPEDPCGPRGCIFFPKSLELRLYKFRRADFENLKNVAVVTRQTKAVFKGVREEIERNWGWCYVGKPLFYYREDGTKVREGKNMVYTVYVNPRLEIYECGWEPSDPEDAFCPEDFHNRYGSRIWHWRQAPK